MSIAITVTEDLSTCFALRHTVFVEEQAVPESEEIDDLDADATHLLAKDGDIALGTARVVFTGDTAKIGRVCVLSQARGRQIGADLIRAALQLARDRGDITKAKLGAQLTALGFYEGLGFAVSGPVFVDAGIEHRDMICPL